MGSSMRLKCFGCGAGGLQVMKALGLRSKDLFVDSGKYDLTTAMKAKYQDELRIDKLNKMVLTCLAGAYFLYPENKQFWFRGARAARDEIRQIKERIWDRMWDEFLSTEQGKDAAMKYERTA
jgi:hypothetical protein